MKAVVCDDLDWPALQALYPSADLLHVGARFDQALECCRGRLVYLATPYTKLVINDAGRFDRGLSASVEVMTARHAMAFAAEGVSAVSPIVQAGAMVAADFADRLDPLDQDFWTLWCAPLLRRCEVVVVPPMTGWSASLGVWHEVTEALHDRKPVIVLGSGEGGLA